MIIIIFILLLTNNLIFNNLEKFIENRFHIIENSKLNWWPKIYKRNCISLNLSLLFSCDHIPVTAKINTLDFVKINYSHLLAIQNWCNFKATIVYDLLV